MLNHMTDEDRTLDKLWREKFGEPLPILGAADVIWDVLGVSPDLRDRDEPN